MKLINPLVDIGQELCSVQNPSRYLGGEVGVSLKKGELFNFAIAFPDLYEIAMCNQAVKIIYNGLNKIDSIRCERVFAPAPDFEELLRAKNIPLYTLETGMALKDVDMIGFSIGYELGITSVLNMLDLGGVPLLRKERGDDDPIIFAGGCGVTNPAPFSDFFDAFFIGEAEDGLFELVEQMAQMKKDGATKKEILAHFARHPSVWTHDMSMETTGHVVAKRAVQADFGQVRAIESFYPLASVKPVQDHGTVEIMRGCPNGCRFCHAGVYYRPQRMKKPEFIFEEIDKLVRKAGYRQISLMSLSSADYTGIGELLTALNTRYNGENVSFQLPSLKVNSMSLPMLEKLSEVRKGGLTFAVETPDEMWQLSLNKEVYAQHLIDIILEAKKKGWKSAKFYFMIGLPVGDYFAESSENSENSEKEYVAGKEGSEEKAIVDFLLDLQAKTQIQCNVNVGSFIPKPHTAYQWIRQISPEVSTAKMDYIRANLPRGKFKVGTHNENVAYLEGLVSRCDERAGELILKAYRLGVRLDAWEDHLRENMPIWHKVFAEASWDVRNEILRARDFDEKLPWDNVTLGAPKSFFRREWERSVKAVLTHKCSVNCEERCGVCSAKRSVKDISPLVPEIKNVLENSLKNRPRLPRTQGDNIPILWRCLFTFEKKDGSEFVSHLMQVEIMQRAFLCGLLPVLYTMGFNPIPRLEFASTLSLGIRSTDEIASCILTEEMSEEDFTKRMNDVLPMNMQVKKCYIFPVTNQRKRESLASSLWGNVYEYDFAPKFDLESFEQSESFKAFCDTEGFEYESLGENKRKIRLPFKSDRPFRDAIEEAGGDKTYRLCTITKIQTLAKPVVTGWTVNDERKWLKDHASKERRAIIEAKGSVSSEVSADNSPISYYDLYKKIAQVNAALIKERNDTEREKAEYLATVQ